MGIDVSDTTNFLDKLVNNELISVEFIHDYLRLHFNNATLTIVTWPTINLNDHTKKQWGTEGYRDALCSLIGKKLANTHITELQFASLDFEENTTVTISLKPSDYIGAEAIIYQNHDDDSWFVM